MMRSAVCCVPRDAAEGNIRCVQYAGIFVAVPGESITERADQNWTRAEEVQPVAKPLLVETEVEMPAPEWGNPLFYL